MEDFFENFYEFCKKVFDKCCEIEKQFFFPDFNGNIKDIKNEDIHHEDLKTHKKLDKTFFLKEINNTFSFDKIIDNEEKKEIKDILGFELFELYKKIEETLPKVSAFHNYTEGFKKTEYKETLNKITDEMYILQFTKTNEHNDDYENQKKIHETGIELPAFSFTVDKRNTIETECYDGIEFLRELKNFKKTQEVNQFFKNYISNLYNNYNKRKADNKKEIEYRQKLKTKLKKEIQNLPISEYEKIMCCEYIDNREVYKLKDFLIEKDLYKGEIPKILNELKTISIISLDDPDKNEEIKIIEDKKIVSPDVLAETTIIKDLIGKYISCFSYKTKNNSINKDKITEIYKFSIQLAFSGDFDLRNRDDENRLKQEIKNQFNSFESELEIVLHQTKNTKKNFLYDKTDSILYHFSQSLIRSKKTEKNEIVKKEMNRLNSYIVKAMKTIEESR